MVFHDHQTAGCGTWTLETRLLVWHLPVTASRNPSTNCCRRKHWGLQTSQATYLAGPPGIGPEIRATLTDPSGGTLAGAQGSDGRRLTGKRDVGRRLEWAHSGWIGAGTLRSGKPAASNCTLDRSGWDKSASQLGDQTTIHGRRFS